jgi:hypothetical protein
MSAKDDFSHASSCFAEMVRSTNAKSQPFEWDLAAGLQSFAEGVEQYFEGVDGAFRLLFAEIAALRQQVEDLKQAG